MDFDQLTTFVYVAKLKSFSRAGQKVFRSQSAVSAQIRQLEQAYRAKLLDVSCFAHEGERDIFNAEFQAHLNIREILGRERRQTHFNARQIDMSPAAEPPR